MSTALELVSANFGADPTECGLGSSLAEVFPDLAEFVPMRPSVAPKIAMQLVSAQGSVVADILLACLWRISPFASEPSFRVFVLGFGCSAISRLSPGSDALEEGPPRCLVEFGRAHRRCSRSQRNLPRYRRCLAGPTRARGRGRGRCDRVLAACEGVLSGRRYPGRGCDCARARAHSEAHCSCSEHWLCRGLGLCC